MRRLRVDLVALARLAVAHHPRCHPFRADVFRVGPVAVCVGCAVLGPTWAATLALLWWLQPSPWWAALAAGSVVATVQLLSVFGWTRTRGRKVGVKAGAGLGLGAASFGVLAAPLPLLWRLVGLVLLAALLSVGMVPRSRRLVRTCESCFFKGDWERCPGMALVPPPTPTASYRRPQEL